jgi:hypothetical protein
MIHKNEQELLSLGLPRKWTRELSIRRETLVAITLGLFLLLLWYPLISVYEIDDAYITYCYARNFAAGHGYSFNQGEFVEGATSPLWTLLLAFISLAGLPLPAYARLLSGICGVVITLLTVRISAKMNSRHRPAIVDFIPAILLNVFPSLPYWTGSGMEISFYAMLLLCAVLAGIQAKPCLTSVFLAILILVRPEAPLIVAFFALDSLLETRSTKAVFRLIMPAFFVFLFQLAFRVWYFGDLMPNTYYAKTGAGLWEQLTGGLYYNQQFVRTLLPSILPDADWASLIEVPVFLAPAVFALSFSGYRILGLLVLANFFAVTVEGGDWMPGWRFWVTGLPLIYILITYLAPPLVGWLAPLRLRKLIWPFTLMLFLTFNLLLTYIDRFSPTGELNPAKETQPVYSAVARVLAEHTSPKTPTALMDVGRVAFESNRPTIDISGLTDKFIAHSKGGFLNKHYSVNYILQRGPIYVFIRPQFSIDRRISADSRFKESYVKEGEILLNHYDAPELAVLEIYRKRGIYSPEHNAALLKLIHIYGKQLLRH